MSLGYFQFFLRQPPGTVRRNLGNMHCGKNIEIEIEGYIHRTPAVPCGELPSQTVPRIVPCPTMSPVGGVSLIKLQ